METRLQKKLQDHAMVHAKQMFEQVASERTNYERYTDYLDYLAYIHRSVDSDEKSDDELVSLEEVSLVSEDKANETNTTNNMPLTLIQTVQEHKDEKYARPDEDSDDWSTSLEEPLLVSEDETTDNNLHFLPNDSGENSSISDDGSLDSFERECIRTGDNSWSNDEFDEISLIGEGGSANVYRARHIETGHIVALKVGEAYNKDQYKYGMLFEWCQLSKINHPNIIKCFGNYFHNPNIQDYANLNSIDFYRGRFEDFRDETDSAIILEYCPDGTLDDIIKRSGPIEESLAAKYMAGLLDALDYLHREAKIIHHDIKPANVLIRGDEAVLVDFDIAERVGFCNLNTISGTPGFVAPEMLTVNARCHLRSYKGLDAKLDMWSTGCVLYKMLSGRMPYPSVDFMAIFQQSCGGERFSLSLPSIEFPDTMSLEAQNLIKSLLRANPVDRLSAQAALQHSWFRTHGISNSK